MKINSSPTRDKYPLHPKKIIKKTIASSLALILVVLFIYGFSAVALITSPEPSILGIISTIVFVFLAIFVTLIYLYQRWYFAVYYYNLDDNYIVIKKGPITPREITIPYERVQDVYVDQDLLDRIFGIYDVHLSSATISSGMEAHIDGVEKEAADGLRKLLLDTVGQKLNKPQYAQSPQQNVTQSPPMPPQPPQSLQQ